MKNSNFHATPSESIVPAIGQVGRDGKGLFYDYFVRITLEEINIEGTMSHSHYARFFGKTRELFGIDCLPGFTTDMGRVYFLQTCNASYEFKKNFHFGDTMIVKMRILRVGNSSFELGAEFIHAQTKGVYATGKQTIIYTDLKGTPIKVPDTLRAALVDALSPKQSAQK